MILSTLQDCGRFEVLHPLFKKAFDYVKSHNLLDAPLGRIEVEGDALFINNSNPECVKAEKQVLEVHRKYIDIHVLLEGEETVGWKSLSDCRNETKPTMRMRTAPFMMSRLQLMSRCNLGRF